MGEEAEEREEDQEVGKPEMVDVGLKELKCKLEEFASARDWDQFHSPRNLLLAMVLSSG